jgi:1,2-diacylglycerol 3-alpha-glucosyltransferase
MKVCIIFFNIGGYHVARLEAARKACEGRGWSLAAIQIAGTTTEHPWGEISLNEHVYTLKHNHIGSDFSLGHPAPLLAALDSIDPDVVAIPGWGFDFARASLRWVRKNRRRAILMSESKEDDVPRIWWKELAKRFLSVRHFSSAIVGGSKHRAYLQLLGMKNEQIFDGYDVIDNRYFVDSVDAIRSNLQPIDIPECVRERKYFLATNRFIHRKNLAGLLNAFLIFLQESEVADLWDLVLLGDGPQKEELLKLVSHLNLESRVHFPGFQSYSDICRWYAFADVFIHPALSEQWGLVVNEAMAAGLPTIVSSACGCVPDLVVHGATGMTFDPQQPHQLTALMCQFAQSPELRSKFGAAGRSHLLKFYNAEIFGQSVVDAANHLINATRHPAKS